MDNRDSHRVIDLCNDHPAPSKKTEDVSCQINVDNSQRVLNIIQALYYEKDMCDVTLVVGKKEYDAHRLILCASSDVFQAMLMRPEWTEWNESRVELQELPQCEAVFHKFIEYLYTGKILITHTNVMPILALADKYLVRSLVNICTKFMCNHVPHASTHNQLFVWLHYTTVCGHEEVSQHCQNYIKWNFEAVANSPDYSNFDIDMFVMILQQSDVVVHNEMVLFNCVVRWLELQKIKLQQCYTDNNEVVENEFKCLVEVVMLHIRFPMMTPRELADLLLVPLVKQRKEFFIDRMAIGMSYHSGCSNQIESYLSNSNNKFMFTPRLYTADSCSAMLKVENFWSIPNYHTSTYVFSSHVSAAEHESHKINEWVVDLYPKGVWFKKCLLIVWQGTFEVPEEILSTVRLTLTCHELSEEDMRVKVSVLIYGSISGSEHVMEVRERIHHFTYREKVINIDNLIPFNELNPPDGLESHETPYLVGERRDILKLNIVISPIR